MDAWKCSKCGKALVFHQVLEGLCEEHSVLAQTYPHPDSPMEGKAIMMAVVFSQHAPHFSSHQWEQIEDCGGYWIDPAADKQIDFDEQAEAIIDQWLIFAREHGQSELSIYGVIPPILRHALFLRESEHQGQAGILVSLYEAYNSRRAGADAPRSFEFRHWLLTGLYTL